MKVIIENIQNMRPSLSVVCLVCGLVLPFLAIITPASLSAEENSEEQGLIDYYISSARVQLDVSDIRKFAKPFSAIVVLRQYSIDTDGDTLQLDTALVRLRYNIQRSVGDEVPDTLHSDTVEILQSSFLSSRPEIIELFLPAPWETEGAGAGEGVREFRLMPDDPASPGLALEFEIDSLTGEGAVSSGLFILDRDAGGLTYSLAYHEESGYGMRYSRECSFQILSGFLVPKWIKEFRTEQRVFGRSSFVIEARIITLRFD